ncbi:aldo/keto reductase [Timonella sp. A28]|uniref:aldo/keto reductase n=1 Tax=Timonella sp. A28 TaxID=3442640 RepID=UPI003EBAE8D3
MSSPTHHPLTAASRDNAPELRRLGHSGLTVSAIGLGCNNLGRTHTATESLKVSTTVVRAAIDAGITLFDVADNYGKTPGVSEEFLGKALGSQRENVIVATKFGMNNAGISGPDFGARGSRAYIMRCVEGSLRRLNTDYIDLYQHHTPDLHTPIDETLSALDDLITQGKVRYIGHSNRSGWQVAQAEYVARELGTARFISSQNHYNLLDRRAELEIVPAAQEFGLGVLPYFPLANGLLTGKYSKNNAPADGRVTHSKPELLETAPWDALAQLEDFARERNMTLLEVAFSWLAAQPVVSSVIAGATSIAQINQNAQAIHPLSVDDRAVIDSIFPPPARIALF